MIVPTEAVSVAVLLPCGSLNVPVLAAGVPSDVDTLALFTAIVGGWLPISTTSLPVPPI